MRTWAWPSVMRWLVIVLAVALADYVSGRLGLLLALPPGFATAVWPPSGIALAAVLLWGYRVWPGVWLGSFAINIFISAQTGPITNWTSAGEVAGSIALGSTAQAIIGAWLIKRFVGFPTPLIFEKDIALFLFLGGPLSCVTAATIGIGTLIAAGFMPWVEAPFQWWTWWIGDTIGVLVMMPLLLIAFAEPREVWRSRHLSVGMPLIVAFTLAIAFFVFSSHAEQSRIQKVAERQNDVVAATLRNSLDRKLDLLQTVGGLFEASGDITRSEFHQLSSNILARLSGIQAIEWSPRVAQDQREEYERSARADGYENFQFTELNNGIRQTAGPRGEYFPVYFVEPLSDNQAALGYDIGSNPSRHAMLEQARDSGLAVASAPLQLLQEEAQQHGVIIAYPIYRRTKPHATVSERRTNLTGFMVMVLRIGDVVTEAFSPLSVAGIVVKLGDDSVSAENQELLAPQLAEQSSTHAQIAIPADTWARIPIEFANRHWSLRLAPTAAAVASQRSLVAWAVLAGGMLFSSLLGAFLLAVTGRMTHVRGLSDGRAKAEERFRLMVEAAPNAMIMVNREGKITLVNAQTEKLFGYTREELIGQLVDILVPIKTRPGHPKLRDSFFAAPKARSMGIGRDLYGVTKSGTEVPVEIGLNPIETPEGLFTLASIIDISERKHAEILSRLLHTNILRQSILDSVPFSIIAIDTLGTIIAVNPATERMLGYTGQEMVGKDVVALINIPEEIERHAAEMSQQFGTTVVPDYNVIIAKADLGIPDESEWTYRCKDGSLLPVHRSITSLKDETGKVSGFLKVAYDITERKRTEDFVLHMAQHDALTGLPNRVMLMDRIDMGIKRARRSNSRVGVLMMDLDHFKRVNDTLGHHVGDQLLIAVTQRIQAGLRESDTLARLGGDEFVVVLPDISSREEMQRVIDTIMQHVSTPIPIGEQQLLITPSLGGCLFPDDGLDANTLLKNADTAMYVAKAAGRSNSQWFSEEMLKQTQENLSLTNALKPALDENQFNIHYQPEISLKTGQMIGMEALIRWKHPTRGNISPERFISLAEETGLILPIGDWVLSAACHEAVRLCQQLGVPLQLAVNVSPRQLQQKNWIDQISRALKESGLPATSLELEITEGTLIQNPDECAAMLREIRALGVRVVIDDFGTGYSSLSYLTRFPIDKIKIDRSFVRDLVVDAADAAIIDAVIAMAHSLKIVVIAEGVETPEQLAYLSQRGCDEVQGYYFSPAVLPSEIPALFRSISERLAVT